MQEMIDPRAFGRLETKVEQLEEMLARQTEAMQHMAERLDAMSELLTQARGGWRVLMWGAGAMAALGSLVTWAVNHVVIKW